MKSGGNPKALKDINVPTKYVMWLRRKIIQEKGLEEGVGLNYTQVKDLHREYGGVLSERMFAVNVLDMPNYAHLANGDIEKSGAVRNLDEQDILSNVRALKQFVIKCKNQFFKKQLKKADLGLLEKCLDKIPLSLMDIIFFSRACVSFREYQRAISFISRNRNSSELSQTHKEILDGVSNKIGYTLKLESALTQLRRGESNTGEISKRYRCYGSGSYTTNE